MGDIADDLDDEGLTQWELHINGLCDESDCPYCQEERWLDE